MGYSKSKKLIAKIEKGQPGGNLYGAVDIADGTWSVDDLIARQDATAQQFVEKYQIDNMGLGPEKAPSLTTNKPTPAVIVKY